MKNQYLFSGILILSGLLTTGMIRAQAVFPVGNDSSDLIDFTLFPGMDPFQSDNIINISLKFDIKDFIRTKHKGEYHNAQFTLYHQDSITVDKEIRVRARGVARRSHCYLPPIKLNFKETGFDNDTLSDISSLKLVTHCKNSKLYDQYLFKEFLVYRMYNLLTDSSFRVKLLHIDYIDSKDKMKPMAKYGFIIESNDHLADRLQGVRIDRKGINTWDTDQYLTGLMDVFQYMIGHTDWATPVLHNIRLVKPSFPYSNRLLVKSVIFL